MQIAWSLDEVARVKKSAKRRKGSEAYLRELGWREFSNHLLYHFPESAGANLNPKFDRFEWAREATGKLRSWQRGRQSMSDVYAAIDRAAELIF